MHFRILSASLSVMLLSCSVAVAVTDGEARRTVSALLAGSRFSIAEAESAEAQLAEDEHLDEVRASLLAYYLAKQDPGHLKTRRAHALWVVNNRPRSYLAIMQSCRIQPVVDAEGYQLMQEAWLSQLAATPDDTSVISNAARFFFGPDSERAEELLHRGQALQPSEPKWSRELARLYTRRSHEATPGEAGILADRSFRALREASDMESGHVGSVSLVDLAQAAYEAGEYRTAGKHARVLLTRVPGLEGNWNHGNVIHHANLVLGRLALREGDIPGAVNYLHLAGSTPGSPQLNSFGPSMKLASELLEQGESDAVVDYFELCGKFWKLGESELGEWSRRVKADQEPDFGSNLRY